MCLRLDATLRHNNLRFLPGHSGAGDSSPTIALPSRPPHPPGAVGQDRVVDRVRSPVFAFQKTYSAAMSFKRPILALWVLVSMLAVSVLTPGVPPAAAAVRPQSSAGCQQGTAPLQNGESVNFLPPGKLEAISLSSRPVRTRATRCLSSSIFTAIAKPLGYKLPSRSSAATGPRTDSSRLHPK